MADVETKQRVADALVKAYFRDIGDLVDVSDGSDDNIHVVVVSRKFGGQHLREKTDLLHSIMVDNLSPDDWGRVTLSIGVSPDDIKNSMF